MILFEGKVGSASMNTWHWSPTRPQAITRSTIVQALMLAVVVDSVSGCSNSLECFEEDVASPVCINGRYEL